MTCPHLNEGRCGLAELLASRRLGLTLECRTDDETCQRCQERGEATEEKPQLPSLGLVTRLLPADRLPEWSAFCSGSDAKRAASTKRRTSTPPNVCVHKGAAVDVFACGCGGSGRREVYSCDVAGKCCDKEKHVERAVEHLRSAGFDKEDRRVRACEDCPDYLPLVTLEASVA